jgi:hypothetical protein
LDSDVVYGYHPGFNYALDTFSFPKLAKFTEHKELKEDCSDVRKNVVRIISKRDIASILLPVFATYVARKMGTVDVGKIICSLDLVAITGGITLLFKKGNPLLDTFNTLMRRYLEAGFQELLWTELQHRASLRGAGRFTEAAGDMVFVFSVSHLMPAFVVLLVGNVLSSLTFIFYVIVNCVNKRRNVIRVI